MSEKHPTAGEVLAHIAEQEGRLVVTRFSHDDAWRLGTILMELATSRKLEIAVDIRRGEQQVFHAGLRGSNADNDSWIARKVNTTKRFGLSSLAVRLQSESRDGGYNWLDPKEYALSGGCFPIRLADGALLGTLTVSGLPDTEDHALAVEALEKFLAG
jgi:uncharacterized protein (UPF0303 family)